VGVVRSERLELRLLPLAALKHLAAGDVAAASAAVGYLLPPEFTPDFGPWRRRVRQITECPDDAPWLVRAAVDCALDVVVGHVGLHGPPENGVVEAGYAMLPAYRGRGYAREAAAALFAWAGRHPDVHTFRLSISPTNAASLAVAQALGFAQVGEQWDDEDGLELVLERPADPGVTP
jgi:ribosomal-protein-alanine N-acetyltransferase